MCLCGLCLLQNTGVAEWVARSLVNITVSSGRFALLLSVSMATSLINGLVSNNACMVLMFPICVTVGAGTRVGVGWGPRTVGWPTGSGGPSCFCGGCCLFPHHLPDAVLRCALQAHSLVPEVSLKQFVCVMMMVRRCA